MTDGASQGLFVIVAVVIFGIFVALAYLLFREQLTQALKGIFETSIAQASSNLAK